MRYRILTLNNISARGLERLPRDRYEVAPDLERPDAILVRSGDMHKTPIPDTVLAVGRAGPHDVVLICGKGHETTQQIGTAVLPFDDRLVAQEVLGCSP